jgi:hypothetical protein
MTADDILQELAVKIYKPPLSQVRDEASFPDLANPFHVLVLLIDCDTEILMNGVLGFVENPTGRHLVSTIEALQQIGARSEEEKLQSIRDCMMRHGVTWERLRGDFAGSQEYELGSFRKLHGSQLDAFASEVSTLGRGFSLLRKGSEKSAYDSLCSYLQNRLAQLQREIVNREK